MKKLRYLQKHEQTAVQTAVRRMQAQWGDLLHDVLLFGSKARGEATAVSDVDLLIIVDSEDWRLHKAIAYLIADVGLEYDCPYLSPRIWSLAHYRELEQMQTALFKNVEREGISLLATAVA